MKTYYAVTEKATGKLILFTADYTSIETFFAIEDISFYTVTELPAPKK